MAVVPSKGELYAPADGTVDTVFDSKHAISIMCDNGAELLLHVGLETVKLEGKHYYPQVKNGQKVKAGQLLMKFDLDELKKEGFDMVTPIVITNSTEFTLDTASKGRVKVGDRVMTLAAQEG